MADHVKFVKAVNDNDEILIFRVHKLFNVYNMSENCVCYG